MFLSKLSQLPRNSLLTGARTLLSAFRDTSSSSHVSRPKKPLNPYQRFANEDGKRSAVMIKLNKEASEQWREMGEEAREPFVSEYEAELQHWRSLKAKNAKDKENMDTMTAREKKNEQLVASAIDDRQATPSVTFIHILRAACRLGLPHSWDLGPRVPR